MENNKNLWVLPTDKPSRLIMYSKKLGTFRLLYEPCDDWKGRLNIYITSDEEIKINDNYYNSKTNKVSKKLTNNYQNHFDDMFIKKIILTTDVDLIKDGVQAIDDEFLEWFVAHPSCEKVDIDAHVQSTENGHILYYKIIIPKEEPKQETLEETAENYVKDSSHELYELRKQCFLDGYKLAQEKSYSEEEVHLILGSYSANLPIFSFKFPYNKWFEQFKKK